MRFTSQARLDRKENHRFDRPEMTRQRGFVNAKCLKSDFQSAFSTLRTRVILLLRPMTISDFVQVVRGLPKPSEKVPCVLAVGNFDGVHLGHQTLLRTVADKAHKEHLLAAVLTFEPHPSEFFAGRSVARISTLRDRYRDILACGIERIYVIPFNRALSELTPEAFARKILMQGLNARLVYVGENFRFGAGAVGTVKTLCDLGKTLGFCVHAADLLSSGHQVVSSSRLRQALSEGDMEQAATLLGHPYRITGRVIHGAMLGRALGFPTLNIDILPPGSTSKPALRGVYAVRVRGIDAENHVFSGVASLGVKPTVTRAARYLLEVNVFDWSGDAYGKIVEITFVKKLRDEKKFSSLDELKQAISHDASQARRLLCCF